MLAQPAEKSRCGEINVGLIRRLKPSSRRNLTTLGSPPESILLTLEFELSKPSPIGGPPNDKNDNTSLMEPHTRGLTAFLKSSFAAIHFGDHAGLL